MLRVRPRWKTKSSRLSSGVSLISPNPGTRNYGSDSLLLTGEDGLVDQGRETSQGKSGEPALPLLESTGSGKALGFALSQPRGLDVAASPAAAHFPCNSLTSLARSP